jgi:putative ABC transport system ATP-binding protein
MDGMQIKNVKKIYDKNQKNEKCVLNDVSFEIKKGEMVAVIGKSGSGKSTLLHILGCMDTISSGTYYLDGIQVDSLSNKKQAELRSSKIGFILQDFGLLPDDTVLENVILPMMFDRTNLAKVKEKAIEKLKLVGMEKQLHQKVATLSGGEKQRVAIARALVKDPDYILADEPTGALDTENAKMFMEQLHKLHRMGKTIVMVTHDLELAKECERMLKIVDGNVQ